jgi:hypothetical protein
MPPDEQQNGIKNAHKNSIDSMVTKILHAVILILTKPIQASIRHMGKAAGKIVNIFHGRTASQTKFQAFFSIFSSSC